MEMGSESIEVIILSGRILFAGFVSRIVDTKLPKCVMFGELMGSTDCVGVSPGRPQSFRHQRRQVNDCSPGRGGIAQDGGTRGGTFYGEIDRCRESQG